MRVAVLGAGIAGLATAHYLKREGARLGTPVEVAVYEASGRPGGRIRTADDAGFRIEWAANGVQGTEGAAWRLPEEVGLGEERVVARPESARRYIAAGGQLHLLPTSLPGLFRSGALSHRAKLRIMAEPLFARRHPKDESVLDFAARHIGREAASKLVGTAVRGIFAGDAARLSVDAAFPIMRNMERTHRSLLFAMASGRKSPGARTLWSLRGGMGKLVEALAARVGPGLHLDAPALSIARSGAGARPGWKVGLASGERIEAEAVVIATPVKAAAALLRQAVPEAARHLSTIKAAGIVVVGLAFRPEAFRTQPDGYGFLVAPGEDLEILGALFESNLFPSRAPEGRILIRAMIGGIERPELIMQNDAELTGRAMKALDRTLGLKCGPERTWVMRQPEAIPQYEVGHLDLVRTIVSSLDALPGLFVTGNPYRGVSVASLVEDAERVAAVVLGTA